ncbi:MAG: prepilin peptidase [Clostridium sp.]|nr:prepilin peptidase [Clostridium sp.]
MSEWITAGAVVFILLRAVYTDVKEEKIENRLMAAGFAVGLVTAYLIGGPDRLAVSVRQALLVMLSMFILFAVKGLGAGDVKLFGVLATFMPEDILSVIIVSFLSAAAFIAVRMLVRFCQRRTMYKKGEALHFSVPIAVGAVLVWLAEQI